MSAAKQTSLEVYETLTGFDEIAIAQRFGHTIIDLSGVDVTMMSRALVFIVKRREGANDEEAWNAAMGMTMKDVSTFFAEAATSDPGKDEAPEQPPVSSLSSVS